MQRILVVAGVIVALGYLPQSRSVQPETRSFEYRGANDEIGGGETFTRNREMLSGEMAIGSQHAHYEGRIAADGTIPRLEIRVWRSAAEAKHPRVLSAAFGGDSTKLIEHLKNHVDTLRFASRTGALPIINPSIGLIELAVARARAQKTRSARVPILVIDALGLDTPGNDRVAASPMPIELTFLAADTVVLANPTSKDQMRLIIGADGRCRGAASGSTARDKFSMRPTSKRMPPPR